MVGGWNLCFGHFGVRCVVVGGVGGVVLSHVLAFFRELCVGIGGRGIRLLLVVDGLFRVVGILGGRAGGGVRLGVGWLYFLRREWVRGAY